MSALRAPNDFHGICSLHYLSTGRVFLIPTDFINSHNHLSYYKRPKRNISNIHSSCVIMSSQDFSQIIPDSVCLDGMASHHDSLQAALLSRTTKWPGNSYQAYSAYPIFTPPHRIRELRSIHLALHAAVAAITRRWWSRPDLQLAIPLPTKIERVIRQLEIDRPYDRVGFLRPDFLVPENAYEPLKVCEINARFLFNCFISGPWVGDAIKEIGLLPEGCALSAATFVS